jgi:cytochrome P450
MSEPFNTRTVDLRHSESNQDFFVPGPMLDTPPSVIPPAPAVHPQALPAVRLLLGSIRNSLAIWPALAFDIAFDRNTLFGVESVLINDPAGVRHVLATNAANYVRPAMLPRLLRPLIGRGLFLAEGGEWRRQRRLLSPSFTPNHVNILLPHFIAAAEDLVQQLDRQSSADLSDAYQSAALNAVLRALFSLPDREERDRIGGLVRQYLTGPGRPQIFDAFANSETSFAFALGRRRSFQKRWFAAVDAIVAARRSAPREAGRDLLDLLMAVRDPETGEPVAAGEVRDQCATMIFAGYETTARLLFWASYLLTLDPAEQARLRAEVAAFPPERVATLDDQRHWPRLRLVLLEALRLYPPVPILVREPLEDDVIMGEPVRRGVQVYVAPWVLHRHRRHWRHPTAFMPDRFAGQSSPWTAGGAYLPFGAGPRICIGAVFALAEAQIVLATVLQRYRLAIASERPVLPVGRLTTQPDHAPLFRLERTP